MHPPAHMFSQPTPACVQSSDLRLIIAGGWYHKVAENVEYLEELKQLVVAEGLQLVVWFMPSISTEVGAEPGLWLALGVRQYLKR